MKYSDFNGKLEALFSSKLNDATTKYQDEDGDWINVDTEEEFNEAKLLTQKSESKILKIKIKSSNDEEETDFKKYILKVLEESGVVVSTDTLKQYFEKVNKIITKKEDKNNFENFLKELSELLKRVVVNLGGGEKHVFVHNKSVNVVVKKDSIIPETSQNWCQPKLPKPKVLGATFIDDVSVPSGEEIEQEVAFKKIWNVKNSGDCEWPSGTCLKFISGSEKLKIPVGSKWVLKKLAKVGETVDVVIDIIAPKDPGQYNVSFSLVDAGDKLFGQKLLLEFKVIENKAMKKWEDKLRMLAEMGFSDKKNLVVLLEKNKGDLPSTIQDHLMQ